MKKTVQNIAVLSLLSVGSFLWAQTGKIENNTSNNNEQEQAKKTSVDEKQALPKPYNPKANAQADLEKLILQAKKEKKNIILQAGGNWCIWCLRFNQFVQTTPELKSIVDKNYLYYHLNYSPDNKNEKIFAKYGNPGDKYGYPVFIILDENGKMIHVQSSEVLEEGKGYSVEKVKDFLTKWRFSKP